jgi:2-methylisocitrate lyase-like PEP mutase family enzyme
MTRPVAEKRAMFRALHQNGCFVLPNPWDEGSARLLQNLGFAVRSPAFRAAYRAIGWTTSLADSCSHDHTA